MAMPSVAVHVTFYNKADRIRYLLDTVTALLEFAKTVFLHTNSDTGIPTFGSGVVVVVHDMAGLGPFDLAKLSRRQIYETYRAYDFTLYIEDDILFTRVNFDYYLRYSQYAKSIGAYVGFVRYEISRTDGIVRMSDLLPCGIRNFVSGKAVFSGRRVYVSDACLYSGLWLLARDELSSFISDAGSVFWLNAGMRYSSFMVRENAAVGPYGVLQKRAIYADDIGALVHHIPDNYANCPGPDMLGTVDCSLLFPNAVRHTVEPANVLQHRCDLSADKSITVAYTAFCVNNWVEVFTDHMIRLRDSVLSSHRCSLHIFAHPLCTAIGSILSDLGVQADLHCLDENDCEFPALRYLTRNSTAYNLYFHTKGVTQPDNVNVGLWNDYLTYFNVDRAARCIDALSRVDCVGAAFRTKPVCHYYGNFWWSTGEHLKKLAGSMCIRRGIERHYAEWFVASIPGRYLSTSDHRGMNLYRDSITRDLFNSDVHVFNIDSTGAEVL